MFYTKNAWEGYLSFHDSHGTVPRVGQVGSTIVSCFPLKLVELSCPPFIRYEDFDAYRSSNLRFGAVSTISAMASGQCHDPRFALAAVQRSAICIRFVSEDLLKDFLVDILIVQNMEVENEPCGDLGPIFRGPMFPCRIMEGSVYAAKNADQRKTTLPSQSWFWKNSWKKRSEYYPTWVQMIVEKGRPPNMEGYQVTWLILVYPDDFHSGRHGGSSGDWPAHSMHIIRTRGHLHLFVVM